MFLRVGLLVLGIFLFVFIGWAGISSWVTVFTEGAFELVDTSRIGGQSAEAPALAAAIAATAIALLAALAAVVAGVDLVRRRRRRRALDGVDGARRLDEHEHLSIGQQRSREPARDR